MLRRAALLFLVSTFALARQEPALPNNSPGFPTAIFAGDLQHRVLSGQIWLIANQWGGSPGVPVATIRNGNLELHKNVKLPSYWEEADHYKLLIGISDQIIVSSNVSEVNAYTPLDEKPEYVKQFKTIYLSNPLPRAQGGRNWYEALGQIGQSTTHNLVLPLPVKRTVRLVFSDGRPLVGRPFSLSLYGSSSNHCGVAVGIPLGEFTTDARGEISVIATNSSLVLRFGDGYYEEESGGSAGTALRAKSDLVVGGEDEITVRKLWNLPEHDYVVHLRTSEHKPLAQARLKFCSTGGCGGYNCDLQDVESDASGLMEFTAEDLRSEDTITVVDRNLKERELTPSEMKQLLTTHELSVVGK